MRLGRSVSGLALFGAFALVATSCGGDDEGGGTGTGGGAGKGAAGSGGKGSGGKGSGGRSGSGSGGSANGGEPGDAGRTSSGGAGGESGGDGGARAGAGGEATDVRLTVRDEASETIDAEDGGTLTLGRLSLEIPPDALEEDTEITIKSFEESEAIFVLEPDGLTFETPIRAHFTIPAPANDDDGEVLLVLAETAPLGEWSELASDITVAPAGDEYRATLSLEHFSFVQFFETRGSLLDKSDLHNVEDLVPDPMGDVPVGTELGIVHAYYAPSETDFTFTARENPGSPSSEVYANEYDVHLDSVSLLATQSYANGALVALPPGEEAVDGAPVALTRTPVTATRLFACEQQGYGSVAVEAQLSAQADIRRTRVHIEYEESVWYRYTRGLSLEQEANVVFKPLFYIEDGHLVDCVEGPSVIGAFLSTAMATALRTRFKAAWKDYCYFLSDGSSCQSPNPELAITNVLDPVFQIGTNAAARIEAAFPCGEGPVGTTLCDPAAGAFAPGEYVFVLATFGGEIPTDDPAGTFQHAFVFDADGIASNNYVPSSEYPKDFFQGTDKWYQVFYTPDEGFSLRVIDSRVSVSNPVATGARLIVAGREFAAFIPRAELDGTAPGFRVTTFRHEGDYGLSGGPWDASYHPPLDEPLMPAAAGETIVLPED